MNSSMHEAERSSHFSKCDFEAHLLWIEQVGSILFPLPCRLAVQRYDSTDIALPLADDPALARAVEKRRREFSAGRVAAATALRQLGVTDMRVPVGENRAPLWPAGIVGSITHTHGLAAAVAARQDHLLAVGLDLEPACAVKKELWASLFTETEIFWISGNPAEEQAHLATLIFSAKESFYKMQYPLTGQWVDFHDAEVSISRAAGEFEITCTQPAVAEILDRHPMRGHYAIGPAFILTGIRHASSKRS